MAEAPIHPLLSLPDDEIIRKLREMNVKEVLEFSLISEKCRDLVESSRAQKTPIYVNIGDKITVNVSLRMHLQFYMEPDMYWGNGAHGRKKRLTPPQSVMVVLNPHDTDTTTTELTRRDFTMKNWMEHLQRIFNFRKIDKILFKENSSEFDADDIKEVFGTTTEMEIINTGCFAFTQSILQKFSPIEMLSITPQNFQDSKIPPSVLIENRAYLNLSNVVVPTITLDELLMINSKVITGIQMSASKLNKFIKLWQRGSNPRMEHLCVDVKNFTEDYKEIIMRGIKHQVIPDDQTREFQSVGLMEPDIIVGGFDFHRMDGVKGTIQLDDEIETPTLEMYAWFDHCHCQPPAHPLLSLPDNKIIRKLRKMSLEEILEFSLISERCKNLVTSIGIKGGYINARIGSSILFIIETRSKCMDLFFYREPDMYWGMGAYGRKKKLTAPQSVLVEVSNHLDDSEDISSELKQRNFTMHDWFNHLQQIFHFRKIDSLWFGENSSEFDIDDIKEVFQNATQVKIEDTGCYDFNQLILQKYFPIEKLEIKTSNFRNSKIPDNILMQNFTELYIHDSEEETTSMKLNEFLLINSKKIVIDSSHMSGQQLNKFLRLWMKGATPFMEHLSIHYNVEKGFDNEIIMNGIEHRVIPRNTRRKFKVVGNELPVRFRGGIDIVRMDGMKATIRNRKNYIFPVWDMYVWFDHCVV